MKIKHFAFTLAEVLITLGIIGVVAAMTMPTLIANHQKKETVTKLKAFNSIMGQAFQMAKAENGDWDTWDSGDFGSGLSDSGDGKKQLEWLQKYILPYVKTTEVTTKGKYAIVGLANGSGFTNYNSLYFFCLKFKDCKQTTETWNSRDRFVFQFNTQKGFGPLSDNLTFNTRDDIINSTSKWHACNKNRTGFCAKLIEYDGWEIKKDYPW